MCIKVIGIDPAPRKSSTVFDGEIFLSRDASSLKKYLNELKESKESVLICWDAPLTGPREIFPARANQGFNLYRRDIEIFFNAQNPPAGISVLGYAGCPHWTISQMLLGLPVVGPYRGDIALPFQLIVSERQKVDLLKTPSKYVVEVHPAVALWLWLKPQDNYVYKPNKHTSKFEAKRKAQCFYRQLKNQFANNNIGLPEQIADDDQLDALVAWLLGTLWLAANDGVTLLGSLETGAMLLPDRDDLQRRWQDYIAALEVKE